MGMTQKRMTVGILAHVDAGKTTLAEGILYLTGEIRALGRVDHKDAFLDNFAMERDRGITIFPNRRRCAVKVCSLRLWIRRGMRIFQRRWSEPCRSLIMQYW